jgi:hypothetical protein
LDSAGHIVAVPVPLVRVVVAAELSGLLEKLQGGGWVNRHVGSFANKPATIKN